MNKPIKHPAGLALTAAVLTFAASAFAEPAKTADQAAPPAACAKQAEQQAVGTVGSKPTAKPGPNDHGAPSAGGAPPPAAGATAPTTPVAVITLSGSQRTAPCADGTIPAQAGARGGKITKSRSNIQNN